MKPADCKFQSTRPRGARQSKNTASLMPLRFQSTRPRGARRRDRYDHSHYKRFNPRARAGRDPERKTLRKGWLVSIHAPARGATDCKAVEAELVEFQSTRPRGARLQVCKYYQPAIRFNPRARAGRDSICCIKRKRPGCFNPRARAGRDPHPRQRPFPARVSIHAPARGATHQHGVGGLQLAVSIHAPARGATINRSAPPHINRFNPRARAGRDFSLAN